MVIVLDDEASASANISILFRLRVQFLVTKCDEVVARKAGPHRPVKKAVRSSADSPSWAIHL